MMITLMDEQILDAQKEKQEELNELGDDEAESVPIDAGAGSGSSTRKRLEPKSFGHIYLGAPQKPCSIQVLRTSYPQFTSKKLFDFFETELPLLNIPIPNNLRDQISRTTQVFNINLFQHFKNSDLYRQDH